MTYNDLMVIAACGYLLCTLIVAPAMTWAYLRRNFTPEFIPLLFVPFAITFTAPGVLLVWVFCNLERLI